MTSQYALYETAKLSERFRLAKGLPKGVKPHRIIKPTMEAPVVVNRGEGPQVELMKWGLVAKGAKDTNSVFRYKTHTVPSEKMLSRHSWENAVRQNRCLVPANGFYEQKGEGAEKQINYIQLKDQPLFALAGIYTYWENPQGITWGTYSILTIEDGQTRGRMPVIISQDDEKNWLDVSMSDTNTLYSMIRSYPRDILLVTEASM